MLATPDHFGPRLFRTGAIPPQRRFAAWREVVTGWLLDAEMRPASEDAFQGKACLRVLPELRFGWGALGGTVGKRTRAIVSRDNDDLFLFVNSGGTFAASQCGRQIEIPGGGAYLMSCTDVGAFSWPGGMKIMAVRTREKGVGELVRNVYDSVGHSLPPDNDGLRLLIRYLRVLHDAEPLNTAEAQALVTRHVQDLIALALGAAGDGAEIAAQRGLRAARLKATEAHIEGHLDDPELGPDAVARHLRMSPRTLQRLFETEGTTFSGFVLGRRLARAHATLGDLRGRPARVADIALACGFGNVSYFNRAFRARYDATPSDIRNRDVLEDRKSSAVAGLRESEKARRSPAAPSRTG
jgi:AraC-like DNA-binding protein